MASIKQEVKMKRLLLILAMVLAVWAFGNICYATDYTQDPYCQGAWLFEEGVGVTVEDSSAYCNTGAFQNEGNPAWSTETPGAFSNYCADFDGGNDVVNVGSDSSLDDVNTFTYVAWIKPEGTPGYSIGYIFCKGHGSGINKGIRDNDIGSGDQDQLRAHVDADTTDAATYSPRHAIADGAWYHLAVTYDDTGDRYLRVYLDGVEVTESGQAAGIVSGDSGHSLLLGNNATYGFYAFNGKLDEMALFSRILSAAEINDIMNNGLKGSGGSASPPQSGDMPQTIRFQANLQDYNADPLEGTFAMDFRLYDTDIGGTPLWQEIQPSVLIEAGFLDVKLGSVTAFNLPFDKQYWLGVEIESDGEMTPRFELTTVPYTFKVVQ
jgi:hypothetical protein